MATTSLRSICRSCTNRCAILVEVDDGSVVRVIGDAADPLYGGYTCVKGRAQPRQLSHPERLLQSMKRTADGFVPIPVDTAVTEIARRLVELRARYGPRSVAGFAGHFRASIDGPEETYSALFDLIGSDMKFDPNTIDKGGKQIAQAMLGRWMAPGQAFDEPDVALLIGVNPLLTYNGFPAGNPNRWLRGAQARGMRLVVIDPRRTDVARKADLHLQPLPGHDVEILAAMIRVILAEELVDADFVAENVVGVEQLWRAVEPFAPELMAGRAGLSTDQILSAARWFAAGRRGYIFAGTGPSMAANGSLVEYLVLVLETLCGHWLRAGEVVRAAPTLMPVPTYKAQAEPPRPWVKDHALRVRSLHRTAAGLPTAAMIDEILLPGDGQIHALISWGGNPAASFPDQLKTRQALESLDLLVQIDPWMTETAKLADYVIAPTMPLEVASTSYVIEYAASRAIGYGTGVAYANYTPPIVAPPVGSAVVEEWDFFCRLYHRVRVLLAEAGEELPEIPAVARAASADELLDELTRGSRIALDEVRRQGGGRLHPAPSVVVAEKDPGWSGRLDVGSAEMMADLSAFLTGGMPRTPTDEAYPFRLLCRRLNHVYNSVRNVTGADGGRTYNPAYLHPDDLVALGLADGALVSIVSARGTIPAIVRPDDTVRPGTVSMAFGFGGPPETDELVTRTGSSTNRLISNDEVFDPYIGQPRMSNVPVAIRPVRRGGVEAA